MPVKTKSKASSSRAPAAKPPPPPAAASTTKDDPEEASGSSTPAHVLDTPQGEIALFRALTRHRPVGPEKHFKMVGLLNVVNKALVNIEGEGGGPEGGVTSEEIWDKLGRMFDLEKLDILNSPASPSQGSPSATSFNLPYSPSFNHLVDGRRLHGPDSVSPPSHSPKSKTGPSEVFKDDGSDSTLSQQDEDEEAPAEDDEEAAAEEDEEEEGEEEEEEAPKPKRRRKSNR